MGTEPGVPGPAGRGAIERTSLEQGVRVVSERMPDVRSVALGFWVAIGSRDEPDALAGVTHFLEHLLFKGTVARSARDIAEAIDAVGGEMNAFTNREYTAYYVRVVDECLDLALDILSDIVWSPALRPDELESERQVVLEEIRMRDDAPDDVVHDVFSRALFPQHALGREVLGTAESMGAMARDLVAAYHAEHYEGGRVVVAAAGNVSHPRVVEGVARRFAGVPGHTPRARVPASAPAVPLEVCSRPTEQAHLVLGLRAFARDDPDRDALSVLNQALGGGMASRLFQEVREKRGLAYAVYSFRALYEETGLVAAYAGTAPQQADEVLSLIHAELDRLVDEGTVAGDELERAKGALKGGLALAQESPHARMHRIGRAELTLGEVPTVDELVARIESVGAEDIARVVDRVVRGAPRTLAAVGPFEAGAFAEQVA